MFADVCCCVLVAAVAIVAVRVCLCASAVQYMIALQVISCLFDSDESVRLAGLVAVPSMGCDAAGLALQALREQAGKDHCEQVFEASRAATLKAIYRMKDVSAAFDISDPGCSSKPILGH